MLYSLYWHYGYFLNHRENKSTAVHCGIPKANKTNEHACVPFRASRDLSLRDRINQVSSLTFTLISVSQTNPRTITCPRPLALAIFKPFPPFLLVQALLQF